MSWWWKRRRRAQRSTRPLWASSLQGGVERVALGSLEQGQHEVACEHLAFDRRRLEHRALLGRERDRGAPTSSAWMVGGTLGRARRVLAVHARRTRPRTAGCPRRPRGCAARPPRCSVGEAVEQLRRVGVAQRVERQARPGPGAGRAARAGRWRAAGPARRRSAPARCSQKSRNVGAAQWRSSIAEHQRAAARERLDHGRAAPRTPRRGRRDRPRGRTARPRGRSPGARVRDTVAKAAAPSASSSGRHAVPSP